MRTGANKFLRSLGIAIFSSIILFLHIIPASSEETYKFERMWPTLQQPWYFHNPHGIAIDRNSNIYVADTINSRIQKFSSDGQFITMWKATDDGLFNVPQGIAVDTSGNVYVADAGTNYIYKFSPDGDFIAKWGAKALMMESSNLWIRGRMYIHGLIAEA